MSAPAPWDEAFLRVESYLHAHRIESRLLVSELATSIIEEARRDAETQPDEPPVRLAMEVLQRRMAAWFRDVFQEDSWKEEHSRRRGRLALVLTDMPSSWANDFLAERPLPGALTERLNEVALQPGPELRLSKMPPAPLEFALGDNEDAPTTLSRRAPWAAVTVWILAAGAMGVAWATTR
jgi:hypothetical protein